MAAFAPLKVGGWAYGEILTSAQMNQLNTDFPFALNLRDGASYTPTGAVSIQTPTTKSVILNGVEFFPVADGGGAQCTGALSVSGAVSCSGLSTGNISATLVTTTNLSVTTNTTLGTTASDTLTVNAKTTANQRVRSPKGMIKGGFSGTTYQYAFLNYDIVYIPDGQSVDPSTVWKISTSNTHIDGTQAGEFISFRHLGSGSAIDIKNPAGTTMTTIGPFGSGNLVRVDIAYDPAAAAYVIVDLGYVG